MRRILIGVATTFAMISVVSAQNLAPQYTPHEQTPSERLQNFQPLPPAPTSYPNLDGGRLNVNPDTSFGGTLNPPSVNVQTTTPSSCGMGCSVERASALGQRPFLLLVL
jgi:hypothetical protein